MADERRTKALELHLAGASYAAIAEAVGYASKASAHKAVQDALAGLGDPAGVSHTVDTELARLDAMLTGLWPKARRGDVAAVDRVLRISERRTQLLAMTATAELVAAPPKETGLSDFERRLAERQSGSKVPRRTESN